jgi:lipopolysaccharide/colanic/teichoic acid biosynthesis glycosyltransferase
MYFIPIILDDVLPTGASQHGSVLTLPLGTGCVLDYLAGELSPFGCGGVWVVSDAADADTWEHRPVSQAAHHVRIVRSDRLPEALHALEASDYLLVVQPRHWPMAGYDMDRIVDASTGYQGVTHAVAAGADGLEPRERVECDAAGQVRCVQRLYRSSTWLGSTTHGVFSSIVPAQGARDVTFRTLNELRAGLLEKGLFTQDVPVATNLADLARPADMLSVTERTLSRAVCCTQSDGYSLRGPGVLVGRRCRIDPSARLVAPIILQHDTCIHEQAVIIGPVTIGPGCTIGSKAVVARSVLAGAVSVASGQKICQQVLWNGTTCHTPVEPATDQAVLTDMPIVSSALNGSAGESQAPALQHSRRWILAIKRLADVALASLGLIVLGPLLAGVAVLVKLSSPGPVFFIHPREGKGGREFGCIKFRTMVDGAHGRQRDLYKQNQLDGPQFKMHDDPRITRLGQWLRTTNIDELPQLLNVLAGQMSLVGPRPSPFRENQICVPWRRARLSVRPGITGMWQICRDRRSDGDFHQWIFYDLTYVRHFSLLLDARILFYTIASKGGRKRVPLSRLMKAAAAE